MREIKIRGYISRQNKFKLPIGMIGAETIKDFKDSKRTSFPGEWCWDDCGLILMQFTGLLDKNGVEIYEGDIVTYKRSVGNWTGQTMTTTHKIIFTEEVNAFVMDYGSSYIKLRKHWGYEYEVIGNIFENPDLLQGVL